jgi:hypothetical protein
MENQMGRRLVQYYLDMLDTTKIGLFFNMLPVLYLLFGENRDCGIYVS